MWAALAWWPLAVAGAQEADALPERVRAAVVRVHVEQAPTAPELDRLYRWAGVHGPGLGPSRATSGTGFLVGDPAVVVTNHHVVAGAARLALHLPDRVITVDDPGAVRPDPRADLAVVTVDGLPPGLATAAEARPGDPVVLVGFPGTDTLRSTAGHVHGARALALAGGPPRALLLTDAAVVRGMSGGPALDGDGRVVGVVVAGSEPDSALGGQGALVPLDQLSGAVGALAGACAPGWLGLRVAAGDDGLQVVDVVPGGPADRAGLATGDTVRRVDGDPARDAWDLARPCGGPARVEAAGRVVELSPDALPDGAVEVGADGVVVGVSRSAWRLGLDPGDRLAAPLGDAGPTVARVAGKGWVIVP